MFLKIFNHFRLTWRLLLDKRVSAWLKLFLIGVPFVYSLIPLPVPLNIPDIVPLVGLLDDLFFISVASLIFNSLCPQAVVQQHQTALGQISAPVQDTIQAYRNPDEPRDLAISFLLIVGILTLTGSLAGILLLITFAVSYALTGWSRAKMLASALQVSERQLPGLYQAYQKAQAQLPPVKANLFVSYNPQMNAYTFGYNEPYTIVLTSALVEKLTPAEIQAVIGHEVGHVLFGHVLLISVMSTSITGLERLLFYRWSRSCEYSADAMALLASGCDPIPVANALLKISSGLKDIEIDLPAFLAQVDNKEAKSVAAAEFLSTHPLIKNRIQRLLKLAEERQPHQIASGVVV